MKEHKSRILFVVDKPDWAYEFMVKTWVELISDNYDCYVCFQEDYAVKKNKNKSVAYRLVFNKLARIKFILKNKTDESKISFISKNLNYYYPVYKKNKVYQYDKDLNRIPTPNISEFDAIVEMAFYFQYISEFPFKSERKLVGIFTDSFPHDGPTEDLKQNIDRSKLSREDFYNKYLASYNHIIVGGGNLLKDYQPLTSDVTFVYGIYGQSYFKENPEVGENSYLTIGWTGSPKRPMKGFEAIILPAIEEVQKTGRDVRLKTKFSGDYEELYSFYEDVDLIVIASNADSGPSLYAEASLSAVPTVSTKVGLPLMGINNGINGLFINRDTNSLKDAIIQLYDNPILLKSMSERVKSDYLEWMDNQKTVHHFLKALNS